MHSDKRKLVLISPVRNEAAFVQATIDSIVAQSLRPAEWVIVDDGSTDQTREIVEKAAAKNEWIKYVHKADRGERVVGAGVVEAFYVGYSALTVDDWNYICKLDGDIELPSDYFDTLIDYFGADKFLGSASGKVYVPDHKGVFVEERITDEMVSGAVNCYRRACFEEIGGFVRQVMWDGIAYHRARMKMWRTRSINDKRLKIIHKRRMGSSHKSVWHGRLRWGRGQYFMGTMPLYILAVGFYRMFERPFVVGGIGIIIGYFMAWLSGLERYADLKFRKSLHAWQRERLKIGHRLEIVPPIKAGIYPS
jgi:biofilm PGA synthesis N-glycosyltransferase PgaC